MLPADLPIARGPSTGLKILGAPIGNLEFCPGVLEKTVAKVSQAQDLLTEMDDPQVELPFTTGLSGKRKNDIPVDSVGLGDIRGCDEYKELFESEQWLAL
jgi:hypothetical protein